MQALRLVTSAALLSIVLGCGGTGTPPDPHLLPSGSECAGDDQCASGHCDVGSGLCCDGGTCCRTASQCPDAFRTASACGAECQGTRQDATCEGFVCGTETVADDSGCASSHAPCGAYAAAACSSSADQAPPTCRTSCTQKSDCADGFGCNGSGLCVPVVGSGAACDAGQPCGDGLKCSNGVCCDAASAESCCATPESCPSQYRAASTCTIAGSATNCQGTARVATCTGNVCGTATVQDDSGCAGQAHACGGYAQITCSSAATQGEPVCATTCSGDAGCAAGFRCTVAAPATGTCVPAGAAGQTCTAWSTQGTCGSALKCDHALCCSAAATTRCCTDASQCTSGLACTGNACGTTCTVDTSTGCASGQYCTNGVACTPKLATGAGCSAAGQCSTGVCYNGACCQRRTCDGLCGRQSNGCGGTLSCTPCPCPPGTSHKCGPDDRCYAPNQNCP